YGWRANGGRGGNGGEGHDRGLAVIAAPAGKQTDFVAQGLFEVDDVAVFNAAPARLRDIKLKGRIVQRLAVAAGKGAVEPCDGSQFSWLGEQRIAGFQFEHIGAALEHPGVEAVGVGDSLQDRKS